MAPLNEIVSENNVGSMQTSTTDFDDVPPTMVPKGDVPREEADDGSVQLATLTILGIALAVLVLMASIGAVLAMLIVKLRRRKSIKDQTGQESDQKRANLELEQATYAPSPGAVSTTSVIAELESESNHSTTKDILKSYGSEPFSLITSDTSLVTIRKPPPITSFAENIPSSTSDMYSRTVSPGPPSVSVRVSPKPSIKAQRDTMKSHTVDTVR